MQISSNQTTHNNHSKDSNAIPNPTTILLSKTSIVVGNIVQDPFASFPTAQRMDMDQNSLLWSTLGLHIKLAGAV